ncbi:Transcription initiation protein spt3 [Loxospora ochrophaea]|nr:Transcription initiation protein spt3 [Loxospora ochrophaea]
MGSLDDIETVENWQERLTEWFQQMMFVSGETGEPSAETLTIIEAIVQQQVIEILARCTASAARRGARTIHTNDLFFLIRHDKAKTSRLKTFLSWKDVRKTAKESDDKGGEAGDLGADDPLGDAAGGAAGGPVVGDTTKKNKRNKILLPWDIESFYSEQVPDREDEEDEDEEEMNYATLQRLKLADERTKNMTKDEYVHFSDCRQASFTFRKGKRFREWAGFGVVTDSKPNDDIIDILGFLTFEMVQTLTEEALEVKREEDLYKLKSGGDNDSSRRVMQKRKRAQGLFDPPEEGTAPVGPHHVREGFRRLQQKANNGRARFNLGGGRALQRTQLQLI